MFFFLFFSLEKILFGDMCCHPDCNPSLGHLFKHKRIKIIRWRLLLFYLYRATLKWWRWRRRQRIDIFAPLWFIHLIFAVVPDPLLFFFCFCYYHLFSMTTYYAILTRTWLRILQSLSWDIHLKNCSLWFILFLLPSWYYSRWKYRGEKPLWMYLIDSVLDLEPVAVNSKYLAV